MSKEPQGPTGKMRDFKMNQEVLDQAALLGAEALVLGDGDPARATIFLSLAIASVTQLAAPKNEPQAVAHYFIDRVFGWLASGVQSQKPARTKKARKKG